MASSAVIENNTASNSIVVAVAQNPALVLIDAGKRDDLYAHIQREIDEFVPDISTNKGREAIKSFAYKITRTKTAIDDAGKNLNEEARARINVIDAARRDAREKLTQLAADVRRPLTEWEDAEKERVDRAKELISNLHGAAIVTLDDTAETVRERGKTVWNTVINADELGDLAEEASFAKDATIATLKTALARIEREEAERAELEKLRAEAAERERIEAERKAADEAKRREEAEKKAAEERQAAAEKAEVERIERAQKEAADRAAREAEEKALREREELERAKQAEIDAANKRAAEAEREAQAERDRIAKEEAARKAEVARIAAEQAKRDADQAHRTKVKTAAKDAIMSCGADEETARKIVLAIQAGEIPHITLRF